MARPKNSGTFSAPVTNEPEPFQLSDEEKAAVLALRSRKQQPPDSTRESVGTAEDLATAFITAIERTKPFEKKSVVTRKKANPWIPKDGSPKILAFKRPMYHHGIEIDPKTTYNEDCLLLDRVRPGKYLNNIVTVSKRKDGGLDIDYPIRTASQRLKVIGQLDKPSFNALLQRIVSEGDARRERIKKYGVADEEDEQ